MKTTRKSLLFLTATLAILTGPVRADPLTAWSQLGFTVTLSSGDLVVTPAGGLTTADAYVSLPDYFPASSTTTDGYALASAGDTDAIAFTLNAGDYFLLDAYASTAGTQGSSAAAVTALSFYDLSFSNVAGATVTLTLTPLFYANTVPAVGAWPGTIDGYVSAFLSLGDASFLSYQFYGDASGYADFTPFTIEVASDATVQLNAAVTAGVSVPDATATLALLALGLAFLAALRHGFGLAPARR